eukprot:SAG31_NODE_3492_length_4201_cov_3.139444_1_plen_249_part_00
MANCRAKRRIHHAARTPRAPEAAAGVASNGAISWETWSSAAHVGQRNKVDSGHPFDDEHACTIERRTLASLTEQDFLRDYYLKRPVIITDATAAWSDAFELQNLRRYNHALVVDSLQSVRTANLGEAHKCPGITTVQLQLGEFIDHMGLPPDKVPEAGVNEPWYVFSSAAFSDNGDTGRALAREILLPSVFNRPTIDRLLTLGPKNSGTQFHKHMDSYSILVSGHKRWCDLLFARARLQCKTSTRLRQ